MSDSDSDENYIHYGTPLEPYDEDEIPSKRKYQDPSEQFALDADGKRRFHGAFTGGFSAGYGNSVATPEGFTPAQFKSSRSEKATAKASRPEDFMDEEDRSEHGIAPKRLQTTSEFNDGRKSNLKRFHSSAIPGEPVLEQLLKPVHETIAVKILKSMGVKIAKKVKERIDKVYGCYVPPQFRTDGSQNSDSDSDVDLESLYALDEVKIPLQSGKNDRSGIGYVGLSRRTVLSSKTTQSHLKMVDKGKKVSIHGEAFGVGALEQDDEDIYAAHDMTQYDFALGAEKEKEQQVAKGEKGCLPGFIRAKRPPLHFNKYPPPDIPRDFVPKHVRSSRFESTHAPQRDRALGKHDLTPETRGIILGEKSHSQVYRENTETGFTDTTATNTGNLDTNTGTNMSVEERIAAVTGRKVSFVSTADDKCGKDAESSREESISSESNDNTFKPFASDSAKQSRYEAFLINRQHSEGTEKDLSETDRLTSWERARERSEFEQAARLYRPLEGVMNERFIHGTQSDDINPLKSVERFRTSDINEESVAAAARGVFGKMTRSEIEWVPAPIVCKRFNIAVSKGHVYTEDRNQKAKLNFSIFDHLESSVHDRDSYARDQNQFSGSRSMIGKPKMTLPPPKDDVTETSVKSDVCKRMTVADLFLLAREKELAESEKPPQVEEDESLMTEAIDKFDKMDLYKAIFLSDTDDSDTETDLVEKPINVERNASPPRGIFANINFDELNSWKDSEKKVDNRECDKESKQRPDEIGPDMYGPKLPDKPAQPCSKDTIESISSSSNDSWVETDKIKDKKQSKKKKTKHKKKKSKHKKHKKNKN